MHSSYIGANYHLIYKQYKCLTLTLQAHIWIKYLVMINYSV